MLLATVGKNGIEISCSELRVAMNQKSVYKKTFLTLQTTISAFQEIDSLVQYWLTVLSR